MIFRRIGAVAVAAALFAVATAPAYAWGPQAQQAISMTALQLLRQRHANVLQSGDVRFDADMLKGTRDGWESLEPALLVDSDSYAAQAIDGQIQLLRGARRHGIDHYFAYRMGVAGALMADAMLPFALDRSLEGDRLRRQIEADLDARLEEWKFLPSRNRSVYIRGTAEYFRNYRPFHPDNVRMIADDYRRGIGYDGFLRGAGETLFGRSVEAVGDIWHTVLAEEAPGGEVAPSPQALTWYYVDAVRYFLYEKNSFMQALRAYDNFEAVNPGIAEAYEVLGDLFYEFGTGEASERGVQEWKIAQRMPGPQRRTASAKLARHYNAEGRRFLETGVHPSAPESDLQSALRNFSLALEYQSTNEEAATMINETNVALGIRQRNHETATQYLGRAETVVQRAEQSRLAEDFASAIATYNQASGLFTLVIENPDLQFPELVATAERGINNIQRSIRDVFRQVLDNAHTAVETGDRAVDAREYQRAIDAYSMVPAILEVVPDDQSAHAREKQDLNQAALERIERAKREKTEWENIQAQQQQQAQ